jgi:hypothetical protein
VRRPRLATLLVVAGALGTLAGAWSLHRVSDAVLMADRHWPRPFPYRDRAL